MVLVESEALYNPAAWKNPAVKFYEDIAIGTMADRFADRSFHWPCLGRVFAWFRVAANDDEDRGAPLGDDGEPTKYEHAYFMIKARQRAERGSEEFRVSITDTEAQTCLAAVVLAALHVLLDREQLADEPHDAPLPQFILTAVGMDCLCLLRDMLDVQNPNMQHTTFRDLKSGCRPNVGGRGGGGGENQRGKSQPVNVLRRQPDFSVSLIGSNMG